MKNLLNNLKINYYIEFEKILPDNVFHEKYQELLNSKWEYSGISNDDEANSYRFWFHDLMGSNFYTENTLARIEELCQQKFKLNRVYANGQTFGQPGNLHIDDENDNAYTFLIYMNPYWNIHWGGNTVFYRDENNYTSYTPKPNFGLLFKSNLLHAGLDPSRECKELRITVAYKLEKI